MTDTSKDAVDRLVLAMILNGNTTAANMLTALVVERDAANARADQARDKALLEAADRLKSVYRVSMTRIGGVDVYGSDAGSPASCYHTILALRDKPAIAGGGDE